MAVSQAWRLRRRSTGPAGEGDAKDQDYKVTLIDGDEMEVVRLSKVQPESATSARPSVAQMSSQRSSGSAVA